MTSQRIANNIKLKNFNKIDAALMEKNYEFLRKFSKSQKNKKIKDPEIQQRILDASYDRLNRK